MTFSLVARDVDGQTFGVATASKYLAVGASVTAVAAGVGALATQASTNVTYRERGLRSLRAGLTAGRTVDLLVEGDPDRERRQLAVLAATGAPATWTGRRCGPVAGAAVGVDCVAVGNLLRGDGVLGAMVETFESARGTLAERLLAGLAAGDAAGGDRRGRQSAALLVASGEGQLHLRSPGRVDLRVDDDPEPIPVLARALRAHAVLVAEPDPATAVPLVGTTVRELDADLRALGRTEGPVPLRLAAWAEDENLEHLLLPHAVDRLLRDELRRHVAARAAAGRG
ncbi:DUF1028 domain-containing protein [Cellulomonas sp. JZ18]|uniref:DUF1028 domain-containing protein n=1 Tax=Cellulomonas sp. JZ18 TaxID=2654191 RepID=UPI0012D48E4C|nr:DUF1028 domain-containing protein [Cellulomonas sp. JZ18]QGQ18474.1 DUF1028 domain-containing protein [Cellulomonas sp. JZ18]